MTRDGDFKHLVRARMHATGERYTAARIALLRQQKEGDTMVPVTVEVMVETLQDQTGEEMKDRQAKMHIKDEHGNPIEWLVAPNDGRQQPWLVLSEIDGDRQLPIACGPVEATAIAFVKQGVKTERPMTHDLLRDVVSAMGEAREVRVTELRDTTFYAELLVIDKAGEERIVSCRPSDGIALALRAKIPILVEESLLDSETAVSQ